MANKELQMRHRLHSDPYLMNLFCPFCGEQIVGEEFVSECVHVICAGLDHPDEHLVQEGDIVFVAHEQDADRDHVFAFRE